jgi:heat shock protein HslJ
MKQITTFLLLALFGLLMLIGYRSAQAVAPLQATASDLADTSWTLTSLGGQLPLVGTTITLQFGADGSVSGSDGCNRFTTTYTTTGSSLRIRRPASTMMACPEAVANQANTFQSMLIAADEYEVRGNQLTLFEDSNVSATFVAASQQLAGTQWQVTAYNNGREAVTSPLLGSDLTVQFQEDGQVAGNAGCNDFFGAFEASDGSITIGPLGSTMRACSDPAGVMQQEAEFLAALESAATYSVEGNFLEMRTADDQIAVHMTRVLEVELPTPEPTPGVPTGRATAPNGLNVRSGPGTNFPVLATVRYGTEGEIIGRSADGLWWVVNVPSAPGGSGWVSANFVAASNAADVPIIASPAPPIVVIPTPAPTPTPVPTAPPVATPAPQMSLRATPTTIDQGQCSTLEWSVENVQAVWVYPQGRPYHQYPRIGQGSERVCPATTTTYEMRVLQRDGMTVFRRATVEVRPAAAQNPLNGTSWEVTGYYIGQAVASPLAGSTITLRFDGQQVRGNGGCNNFNGPYWVSGSNISIGELSASMAMCDSPAGVMQQESDVQAALRASSTFQFDGNRLTLRRGDGSVTIFANRLQ